MRFLLLALALIAVAQLSSGKIYFQEDFSDDKWTDRWVVSGWKKDSGEAGELKLSSGKWSADASNKGLQTSQDARFYAASAKMSETFDNTGKDLVFQFSVKNEQKIDCGGGYLKLLPPGTDQAKFNGDAKYEVMFGPDICGYSTKKVQAILNAAGENLLKKDDVKCPDDEFTHFYTFIIKPDDTYEIRVDNKKEADGKLKDAWAFEKPKKIKDPKAKKPEDWVDDEMMDDPEDKKPDDWDSEPEKIADPEAKKPDDWNDEDDGEWEAPMIDNPKYKGEWKPKKIKNPAYKGPWVHPEIDNPDWKEVKDVYKRGPIGVVGFEIWQVKSGTIFDNILLTDSVKEAEAAYEKAKVDKDAEEKAKKAFEDKDKKEEKKDDDKKDDDEETEKDEDADADQKELDKDDL